MDTDNVILGVTVNLFTLVSFYVAPKSFAKRIDNGAMSRDKAISIYKKVGGVFAQASIFVLILAIYAAFSGTSVAISALGAVLAFVTIVCGLIVFRRAGAIIDAATTQVHSK